MSTAAIVVVVVGACIGVVTSIMTRTLEPATKRPAHERDRDVVDDLELDEPDLEPEPIADQPESTPTVEPEPVNVGAPLAPGVRPPSIRAARALLATQAAAPTAPARATAPAAARTRQPRGRPIPRDRGVPNRPTRWWERLRSAVALTTMSVVLGLLAAAAIGIAMVALFSLLRSAVG